MTVRSGKVVALGVFATWVVLELVGLLFLALTWHEPHGYADSQPSALLGVAASSTFALVGLLLAAKRPRNAIGWIFLAIALSGALDLSLPRYGIYATLERPGSLPRGVEAGAVLQAGWVFLVGSIALLLLLFPHGNLPSPRWRAMLLALLAGVAATWVGGTTRPGPLPAPFAAYENPLGIGALRRVDSVLFAGWILMVSAMVAGAVSLALRFRRAEGIERQQYRLFVAAALAFPIAAVTVNLFEALFSGGSLLVRSLDFLLTATAALSALLLPIATAVAVLRYRLYEIDRIVSRALVYGSLTVVLGAAYVGLVLGGQALFSSIAGGSNLAIAVSTLVVAALFLPLRTRIQRLVDRRFYRRRYDAQRTLDAFGARLREELDLEALTEELRGAVAETVQPTRLDLWLRHGTTP